MNHLTNNDSPLNPRLTDDQLKTESMDRTNAYKLAYDQQIQYEKIKNPTLIRVFKLGESGVEFWHTIDEEHYPKFINTRGFSPSFLSTSDRAQLHIGEALCKATNEIFNKECITKPLPSITVEGPQIAYPKPKTVYPFSSHDTTSAYKIT